MLFVFRCLYFISRKTNSVRTKLNTWYYYKQIQRLGGKIGRNCIVAHGVKISGLDQIDIGDNVAIGSRSFIRAEGGLTIGNNTILSRNVIVYTTSHQFEGAKLPFDAEHRHKSVSIDENCWLGMNVTVSPGTWIKEGCIIGLGANVHGELEKLGVYGASPLSLIKHRNKEHYISVK